MTDVDALVAAFFNRIEAQLRRDVAALADERGRVNLAECERLFAKQARTINRAFDRWAARVRRKDAKAGELLQQELEPLRAMLERKLRDGLRPH